MALLLLAAAETKTEVMEPTWMMVRSSRQGREFESRENLGSKIWEVLGFNAV